MKEVGTIKYVLGEGNSAEILYIDAYIDVKYLYRFSPNDVGILCSTAL